MTDIPKLRRSENSMPIYTARREGAYGQQWVVRDQDGSYVDNDQYRYDLETRYPGLRINEE